MPNIGGPAVKKKKMLAGIAHSNHTIRLACMCERSKENTIKTLERLQRIRTAIRLCCAYRTTSTEATIARIMPITLMIKERTFTVWENQARKKDMRKTVIARWQELWERERTKQMIKNYYASHNFLTRYYS